MPQDADHTDAGCSGDTVPKRSGKVRLLTLDALDRRTKAAQHAFEFRDKLIAERGGAEAMSALRVAMIESVAVVSAMVVDAQARWLRGEAVDLADLATLLNARRREAQMVGLDGLPKDITPTLAEYISGRAETAA